MAKSFLLFTYSLFFSAVVFAQTKTTNPPQTYQSLQAPGVYTGDPSKLPQGYYPAYGGGGVMGVNSGTGGGFGIPTPGMYPGMNPSYPAYGMSGPPAQSNKSSGRDKKEEENPNQIPGSDTAIRSSGNLAKDLIWWIPDKTLRSGVKEYLRIVNPGTYEADHSVGSSNKGISEHFSQEWAKNACFQKSAVSFYRDVNLTLAKGPNCRPVNEDFDTNYYCGTKRPEVGETAGQGDKKYLQEGWLMKLALKHAGNNPAAALQLIGMCGTDDTAHASYGYFSERARVNMQKLDAVASLKAAKKETDQELKAALANFDSNNQTVYDLSNYSQALQMQIRQTESAPGMESLDCPGSSSDFYLPGSLGPGIDISEDMKNQIKRIQDPLGKKHLAAKNYHVLGAAYLGCKMAMKGVKSKDAKFIESQAAHMYRAVRICSASRQTLATFDAMEKYTKAAGFDINDSSKILPKLFEYIKRPDHLNCNHAGFWAPTQESLDSNFDYFMKANKLTDKKEAQKNFGRCMAAAVLGVGFLSPNTPREEMEKIVKGALLRRDTAYLYRVWYMGGEEFFGNDVPCTGIRNGGPADLMKATDDFVGMFKKPGGWDKERYDKATKNLATWDIDFRWTIAQHEVGAEFGAKACKNNKISDPFAGPRCDQAVNSYVRRDGVRYREPVGDERITHGTR